MTDDGAPGQRTEGNATEIQDLNRQRQGHEQADGLDRAQSGVSHFVAAHGHKEPLHSTHSGPLTIHHLWKPPVVRQWIYDGKLYKEASGRDPSRLELFFDLAFAGIVHQLAEKVAESPTGIGLAQFILVYYPSWSIWKDTRDYSNISGSDDAKFRLYILAIMLLLYGYSANASGIEVEHEEASEERAGGYAFAESAHSAIQAAVAYFLVAKLLRVLLYVYCCIRLPRFRVSLLHSCLYVLSTSAIYFPLLFVTSSRAIVALASTAIAVEMAARFLLGAAGKTRFPLRPRRRRRSDSAGSGRHVPAINVEHLIERTLQFTVIFLGESVISSIYRAGGSQFGVHSEYGRSALGIVVAFSLIWLYFDQDSSRTFVHALRRHWFTNVCYTQLHFPLTAGIVLFSAALSVLIPNASAESEGGEGEDDGVRWYFCGGSATVLLCIALVGLCHRSMDKHRSGLLPRSVRLALRFFVAAFVAVFPLFGPDDSTAFVAVVAAVLAVLVFAETMGKIGSIRVDLVHNDLPENGAHTKAAKAEVKAQKHYDRHKDDLTENEKGEEDVGVETELGDMEVKNLHPTQRLAYTA